MAALKPGSTIGIFGSGQLGRMLAMAGAELGLKTHIYSDVTGPALDVAPTHTIAPYADFDAIKAFAESVDVITFEFENIALEAVSVAANYAPLAPGKQALEVAQDRFLEKSFISNLAIPVAPFAKVDGGQDLKAAAQTTGLPGILKTRRFGYDGKGQSRVRDERQLAAAFAELGDAPAILEGFVDFVAEVSILVVRNPDGEVVFYDMPENQHKDGILDTSTVPANVSPAVAEDARALAQKIADALDYVGVLAIELFVMADSAAHRLVVNEIAPRVHNSGHWTLDACQVSQFENHMRAVAGWPLGATDRHSDAIMTNLIGEDVHDWPEHAGRANTSLHLYGKNQARPGRKMGHITEIRPRGGSKTG